MARLVAALGQAVLYAMANGDHEQTAPRLDLQRAALAVSGLGLALSTTEPCHPLVAVSDEVVAWTRDALAVLHERVSTGAWSCCPCGDEHNQAETDQILVTLLDRDLRLLPRPVVAG